MRKQSRWIVLTSALVLTLTSTSCQQNAEEGNVAVLVPQYDYFLVPDSKASCYATKVAQGTGVVPSKDISEAYAFIPRITISRKDAKVPLTLTFLRLKAQDDTGTTIDKVYNGEELASLKSTWWTGAVDPDPADGVDEYRPPRLARMAIGEKAVATDCATYLGGLPQSAGWSGTVEIEIVGYEGDDQGTAQLKPFSARTMISVMSYQ